MGELVSKRFETTYWFDEQGIIKASLGKLVASAKLIDYLKQSAR